jgi:HD-GYP domain-containing protein (c-di-GMP phosphodiesterase class II)
LTTNRPYQQAREVHETLKIIHSLSGKRLDPAAVFALDAVYQRGEIRIPKQLLTASPAVATRSAEPQVKAASAQTTGA